MKKITIFILSLLFIFISISCRPDINTPSETPESWSELFTLWWSGMNKNYVFWSIDSPGNEWDLVRNKYLPRMEEYGKIGDSIENDRAAMTDFFDITKTLHDGHYRIEIVNNTIVNGSMLGIKIQPSMYRAMLRAGLSDEEALRAITGEKFDLYLQSDFIAENTFTILENTFGITDSEKEYGPTENGTRLADYFSKAGYYVKSEEKEFSLLVGLTHDNILYIAFSGFDLNDIIEDETNPELASSIKALLDTYQSILKENETNGQLKGLIVDLRGNGGGNPRDFDILWSPLIQEQLSVAQLRTKQSDNRLSYSSWHDFPIGPSAEKRFDKPIAVITNSMSASCSEISTMFFMAFREKYNADVKIFGATTIGANGLLDNDISQPFNAGIFSIEPYIKEVYTPSMQTRYIDGTMYEGIGISPDQNVAFNYNQFLQGNDARLHSALEWMKSKI